MDVVTGGAMTWEEVMRERCDDCRFFMDFGNGTGTCHRYPPSWHAGGKAEKWPIVNTIDWCGEWQTCAEAKDDMAPAA